MSSRYDMKVMMVLRPDGFIFGLSVDQQLFFLPDCISKSFGSWLGVVGRMLARRRQVFCFGVLSVKFGE